MQLENSRRKSDDKTITMAVNFVKQIKKVSIIVNDGRGGRHRVVISYLNEGMRLSMRVLRQLLLKMLEKRLVCLLAHWHLRMKLHLIWHYEYGIKQSDLVTTGLMTKLGLFLSMVNDSEGLAGNQKGF